MPEALREQPYSRPDLRHGEFLQLHAHRVQPLRLRHRPESRKGGKVPLPGGCNRMPGHPLLEPGDTLRLHSRQPALPPEMADGARQGAPLPDVLLRKGRGSPKAPGHPGPHRPPLLPGGLLYRQGTDTGDGIRLQLPGAAPAPGGRLFLPGRKPLPHKAAVLAAEKQRSRMGAKALPDGRGRHPAKGLRHPHRSRPHPPGNAGLRQIVTGGQPGNDIVGAGKIPP